MSARACGRSSCWRRSPAPPTIRPGRRCRASCSRRSRSRVWRGSSRSPPRTSASTSGRAPPACCRRRSATCPSCSSCSSRCTRASASSRRRRSSARSSRPRCSCSGSCSSSARCARGTGHALLRRSRATPRRCCQVCVFIIVIVGLALSSRDPARHHVKAISAVGGGLLLIVYLAWVIPYVRSDGLRAGSRGGRGGEGEETSPPVGSGPLARAWVSADARLLVGAGVAAAFVSDWFVDALAPAISILHVSEAFAGLVIVAIASNAVEQVAGVVLAARQPPTSRSRSSSTPSRRSPRSCSRCWCSSRCRSRPR